MTVHVLSPSDRASVALHPELRRLVDLRESGWVFMPVPREGVLELVAGARQWRDGWSDAIAIRSRDDAKAYRCDPSGGEVWGREGGLAEVLDALVDLPAPGHPDAPRLVRGSAPTLWLPGAN